LFLLQIELFDIDFTNFTSRDRLFETLSELSPPRVASPDAIDHDIAQSGMAVSLLDGIAAVDDEVPVSERV
jgi:hypothetical protein